ncbi:MAG: hypothetical protein ABIJ41_05825 [Candidatus Omnitrophota bacterium]
MAYNSRGSVLLLVVFLLFFLALFVIGISQLASTDFQIAQNNKFSLMAYYVAEAGIGRSIYELRQNNNWSAGFNQVQFPIGANSTYTVAVTNGPGPMVTLNSLGVVENTYRRRIFVRLMVLPTSVPYPLRIRDYREIAP